MNHNQNEALAYEIAEMLKDDNGFPLFLSYTERYSEDFLRQKLNHVLSLPENKIRKSRAALFTFLIEQHASREHRYPRY